ncbi:MAG: hypothetical protein M3046_12675 [Actinomycetota bacterium]|nr:hypothetical protein [Actinomycetota bacterium]
MTTVQYVAATAFSLIVFVMMANFIVFLYARGVVRASVDEGARAGSRFGATTAECESRARDVLGDLLAGRLGSDVKVECQSPDQEVMRATVHVTLHGWLPGVVPDWTFALGARSAREHP